MNQSFGIAAEGDPAQRPHRAPARFLVLIDAGGISTARLFLADRSLAEEFFGGGDEVAQMTRGLTAAHGASGPEWDAALGGQSAAERAAAQVYTLDV